MGQVDKMLLDSLKKKSLERMKASEEYNESDGEDDEENSIVNVNTSQDCIISLKLTMLIPNL